MRVAVEHLCASSIPHSAAVCDAAVRELAIALANHLCMAAITANSCCVALHYDSTRRIATSVCSRHTACCRQGQSGTACICKALYAAARQLGESNTLMGQITTRPRAADARPIARAVIRNALTRSSFAGHCAGAIAYQARANLPLNSPDAVRKNVAPGAFEQLELTAAG